MATTQLGLSGTPQALYEPFQPKGAAQVQAEAVTGLGLYGGPRAVYLAFLPKSSAAGVLVEAVTGLGLYGGPRAVYPAFLPKTAADVPEEPPEQVGHGGGGYVFREGDAERIEDLFTVHGRVRARAHAGVAEAHGTVTNPVPAPAIPSLTTAAVPTSNVLHGRVASTADAFVMVASGSVGMGTEDLEDIAIAALADEWWEDV